MVPESMISNIMSTHLGSFIGRSCCRKYVDKQSILEQTLNERVLLARQLEDLIRMADHVTRGLSPQDLQPEAVDDEELDD